MRLFVHWCSSIPTEEFRGVRRDVSVSYTGGVSVGRSDSRRVVLQSGVPTALNFSGEICDLARESWGVASGVEGIIGKAERSIVNMVIKTVFR